jgi:hypothetical protein
VERERPLDADTERLLAHGERLSDAGALPLDDDAFEDLDAAALSLDHLEVDAHRVARFELRQVGPQLALFEKLDGIRHGEEARRGLAWMLADECLT